MGNFALDQLFHLSQCLMVLGEKIERFWGKIILAAEQKRVELVRSLH
ncbi:hypothetical protein [Nostoc sp. T09]|nr:hypothetical protein [Nostoc sp. T09]